MSISKPIQQNAKAESLGCLKTSGGVPNDGDADFVAVPSSTSMSGESDDDEALVVASSSAIENVRAQSLRRKSQDRKNELEKAQSLDNQLVLTSVFEWRKFRNNIESLAQSGFGFYEGKTKATLAEDATLRGRGNHSAT